MKLDLGMLGWLLLLKTGKANILSKCLVIDGTIETVQLSQVFMSEAIFKLLLEQTYDLRMYTNNFPVPLLEKALDKEIMRPCIELLVPIFKSCVKGHIDNISAFISASERKA